MGNYIDLILTADGYFCQAPSWSVKEGDHIVLENPITGANELKKVIATVTDSVDGDFIKMVRAYIGCEPYKITKKYTEANLYWGDENAVSE